MGNNLRLLGVRFSRRCIEIHLKSKMYAIIFRSKKSLKKRGDSKAKRIVVIKYNKDEYAHCMNCNLIKINGFFGLIFCNK